jgi:hypothetical protein
MVRATGREELLLAEELSRVAQPAERRGLPRPSGAALKSRARAAADAIVAARVDLGIVCAITLFAAVLRLWRIASVPLGLHGDEAWTGIDAQRILDEGWIGPYVESALGQPSGPLYFTAALFSVLPDSTATIRLSMALLGVATIPLAYLAFASMFNRTVAAFAAFILATMMWHVHLGRLGFMVTTWPLAEVAVLLAFSEAMRRRSMVLFALAGALTGLGLYTYNGYLLFLPIVGVALVGALFPLVRDAGLRRFALAAVAVFAGAAVLVALPMLHYIDDNTYEYRYHQRGVSVANTSEWEDADLARRADILWDRGIEWGSGLARGDRVDLGDGLASEDHPVVHPAILALALVGFTMALWRWKRWEYVVVVVAALVLPWGALLTTLDGLFRRTFGLAPFIAVLAALPLAWAWQRMLRSGGWHRFALAAALLVLPALAAAVTVQQYFREVQDDAWVRFVFPYELDAASRHMATLPDETLIYFYSERWPFDYETREFLAPDARGVDRSLEFRPASIGDLDLSARDWAPGAFVFLGAYLEHADAVEERYPGGVMTEGVRDGEVVFRAYRLPQRGTRRER